MNDLDEWIKQSIAVYVKDTGLATAGQIKEVMASWVNHADSSPYGDYITTTDAGIDNTITVCTNPNNVPRINNWEKFQTVVNPHSAPYHVTLTELMDSDINKYIYELVAIKVSGGRYEFIIRYVNGRWEAFLLESMDKFAIPDEIMKNPLSLWNWLTTSFKIL